MKQIGVGYILQGLYHTIEIRTPMSGLPLTGPLGETRITHATRLLGIAWLKETKNDPFIFAGKHVAVVPFIIVNLVKGTFGNLITEAEKRYPVMTHVSQVEAKQF